MPFRFPRRAAVAALVCLAAPLVRAHAQAEVLVTNFPVQTPGLTYEISLQRQNAVGIRMGSDAWIFGAFRAPIGTGSENIGAVAGGIYSDASGIPGTLLAAFNDVSLPPRGSLDTNVPIEFTTANPFTLQPNTVYWMVLRGTNEFTAGWFDAAVNASGVQPGIGAVPPQFNIDNTGWEMFSETALRYEISGLRVPVSTVPEPGTSALLGSGLAALVLVARRRVSGSSVA